MFKQISTLTWYSWLWLGIRLGLRWSWGWKKLKAVFQPEGDPFYDFGGKIAVFGLIFG